MSGHNDDVQSTNEIKLIPNLRHLLFRVKSNFIVVVLRRKRFKDMGLVLGVNISAGGLGIAAGTVIRDVKPEHYVRSQQVKYMWSR